MSEIAAAGGGGERVAGGLGRAVRDALPLAAVMAVAAGLLAFLASLFLTPQYRSEAIVGLYRAANVGGESDAGQAAEEPADPYLVISHAEVLRSSGFQGAVARKVMLASRDLFAPEVATTPLTDILVGTGLAENPLQDADSSRLVASFGENVSVEVDAGSSTIAIRFLAEDPEIGATVANAMADHYAEIVGNGQISLPGDADAAQSAQSNSLTVRLLAKAVPAPTAVFPNKSAIMATTAFFVLLLALAGIVVYRRVAAGGMPSALEPFFKGATQERFKDAISAAVQTSKGQSGMIEPLVAPSSRVPMTTARPEKPVVLPESNDLDAFTVEAVADLLEKDGVPLAVCLSPEGDEGSAVSVMLARTAAGEGRRVILIDLTASACPTALMAESHRLPGLTNLLCGEIDVAAAIHPDRLSDAHIVPRGQANVRRAMREIDRMSGLIESLVDAYDLVIIECGAADADGVARIVQSDDAEIVISVVQPDMAEMVDLVDDFLDAGFHEPLLMTSGKPARKPKKQVSEPKVTAPEVPEPIARLEALIGRKTVIKPIAMPEPESPIPDETARRQSPPHSPPNPGTSPLFKPVTGKRSPLKRSSPPQL